MITDSEKQLEKIFLSYDSILEKLKLLNMARQDVCILMVRKQ